MSQFNYNSSKSTYNKNAFGITGYIHNEPLTTINMDTMRNIIPNTRHWGGGLVTLNAYLTNFGNKNLTFLNNYVVQSFQVLPIIIKSTDSLYMQTVFYDIINTRALNPNALLRADSVKTLTEYPV